MAKGVVGAAAGAAFFLAAGPLAAAPSIGVELNKLEPVDGACRAYLLFRNETESNFASLRLDLVLFGTDGVIAKRLAVEAAPLTAGKTSLKLFDIQGLGCPDLGQVLLNDITACKDQSGERSDCGTIVRPASKAKVEFTK